MSQILGKMMGKMMGEGSAFRRVLVLMEERILMPWIGHPPSRAGRTQSVLLRSRVSAPFHERHFAASSKSRLAGSADDPEVSQSVYDDTEEK